MASPASTALSVVTPDADAHIRPDGACSDPDVVHNKLVAAAEPVAEMSTAPEAEDEPGPLPDSGVPMVRITEAPSSPITASSPRQSTQTDPLPHASAPSQRASLSAGSTGPGRDRSRRATMDARASNRISGFFSQLLPTRRNDPAPPVPSPSARDPSVSPPGSPIALSFAPPPRPSTPPPCLPAPTLSELGLSLTVLTPSLTSTQYATPPTNGTFLAPHYLLLCHAQGLDVFPLVGPPSAQPYALVRRVAFKSVIVMEERGVLVAIAGRRDGVRVYALEEVRRAVEWRLELEIKREAENTRRSRELANKGKNRASVQAPIPGVNMPASSSAPSALGPPQQEPEPPVRPPLPPPPSYASSVDHRPLITRVSTTNLAAAADAHGRTRGGSLSSVVGLGAQSSMHALVRATANNQQKSDWGDVPASDDEALVAAGPEASAALDERTSAGAQAQAPSPVAAVASPPLQIGGTGRRATVSTHADGALALDRSATLSSMRNALAHSRSNNLLPRAPTLQSELTAGGSDGISFAEMLRESRLPPPDVTPNQAIRRASVVMLQSQSHPVFTGNELDQVNEDTDHPSGVPNDDSPRPRRWSFVAPSTASLPDPVTATQPQTPSEQRPATLPAISPIPLPSSPSVVSRNPPPPSPRPGSHRSTRSHPIPNGRPVTPPMAAAGPSRRRLLPKLFGAFGGKKDRARSRDRGGASGAGLNGSADAVSGAGSGAAGDGATGMAAAPKLEYIKLPGTKGAIMIKAVETAKKSFLAILCGESGEKVELFAGTYRTALGLSRTFILPDSPKSLELQLQGDDLVEVFLVFAQNVFGLEPATVRVREVRIGRNERRAARRRARAGAGSGTGSGAQPTRQEIEPTVVTTTVSVGDDPAPVSSGAVSRRSASLVRRRREVSGRVTHNPNGDVPPPPPLPPNSPGATTPNTTDPALAEEMANLTAAQAGAYTTFQQLSFAPAFPLAVISDDYVIPPTYSSFCEYREQWEPDAERVVAAPREAEDDEPEVRLVVIKRGEEDEDKDKDEEDESPRASGSRRRDSLEDDPAHALQFTSPPASVVPTVVKWFYLDPKGVVQGPWKPSIMQNWLREGYLPPELPVRRADETEYTLLRDLRLQVDDPAEPFKPVAQPLPPPPPQPEPAPEPATTTDTTEPEEITTTVEMIHPATPAVDPIPPFGPTKALLKPISLLSQPRHFGPPALFYCSRGGHSTTVVDARGRAVLKGRVHWSTEHSMGDTQRVEAFDVDGRAVLVALRQGGIEATDVGQALLDPADESRTALPNYKVGPGAVSRRSPYVWRLGTAVTSTGRPVGSTNGKRRAGTGGRKRGAPSSSKQNGASNVAIQGNDSGDESDVYIAPEEEVIFLARQQDNVYVCERSAGKFRILRLSKTNPTTTFV